MADDDIGYGKPPKHTQFKKGESGNPTGKPKKPKDAFAILDKHLAKTVTITQDGQKVKTTALEVIVTQLVHGAMKGSLPQTKLLLMLVASRPQEPDAPLVALTPEWITLLEDIMTTKPLPAAGEGAS